MCGDQAPFTTMGRGFTSHENCTKYLHCRDGEKQQAPVLSAHVPAALSRDARVFAVREKQQLTKVTPRQLAPRDQ